MNIKKVIVYKTKNGKEPFTEWLLKLDNTQRIKILSRLKRLEYGNYGFYKVLSEGICELNY